MPNEAVPDQSAATQTPPTSRLYPLPPIQSTLECLRQKPQETLPQLDKKTTLRINEIIQRLKELPTYKRERLYLQAITNPIVLLALFARNYALLEKAWENPQNVTEEELNTLKAHALDHIPAQYHDNLREKLDVLIRKWQTPVETTPSQQSGVSSEVERELQELATAMFVVDKGDFITEVTETHPPKESKQTSKRKKINLLDWTKTQAIERLTNEFMENLQWAIDGGLPGETFLQQMADFELRRAQRVRPFENVKAEISELRKLKREIKQLGRNDITEALRITVNVKLAKALRLLYLQELYENRALQITSTQRKALKRQKSPKINPLRPIARLARFIHGAGSLKGKAAQAQEPNSPAQTKINYQMTSSGLFPLLEPELEKFISSLEEHKATSSPSPLEKSTYQQTLERVLEAFANYVFEGTPAQELTALRETLQQHLKTELEPEQVKTFYESILAATRLKVCRQDPKNEDCKDKWRVIISDARIGADVSMSKKKLTIPKKPKGENWTLEKALSILGSEFAHILRAEVAAKLKEDSTQEGEKSSPAIFSVVHGRSRHFSEAFDLIIRNLVRRLFQIEPEAIPTPATRYFRGIQTIENEPTWNRASAESSSTPWAAVVLNILESYGEWRYEDGKVPKKEDIRRAIHHALRVCRYGPCEWGYSTSPQDLSYAEGIAIFYFATESTQKLPQDLEPLFNLLFLSKFDLYTYWILSTDPVYQTALRDSIAYGRQLLRQFLKAVAQETQNLIHTLEAESHQPQSRPGAKTL